MATAPVQLEFPFLDPNPEYPAELHKISKNRAAIGQVYNTIRRGSKWAKVPVGHEIVLTEGPSHDWVGIGQVERVSYAPFKMLELSKDILDANHGGALSYASLLETMRKAYGEGFREDEYVVILWYKRIR